jgi:hypothetical protein
MSIESFIFIGLFVKSRQTPRGGRIGRYGQKISNAAKSAAREGTKNAAIGGASGYLSGANRAQQQGGGAGKEILGGIKGGIKGAAKGGLKGAVKGAKEGASKNSQIPNQDARTPGGGSDENKTARRQEEKYNSAKERGGSNSPKAFFNQLKNRGQLNSLKNLNKIQPDLRKHENMNEQAKKQFNKLAKKAIKQGIRQAGRGLAAETFGLSVVAAEALIHWRETLTIGIALFLILFMLFDAGSFDAQSPQQDNTPPTTSDTCNPAQFSGDAFGKTSVCTITVTDAGSAQDITIVDSILQGTEFAQAFNNGTFDPQANTVTWDAQKDGLQLNPVDIIVSVIVRINTHQKNIIVYNSYTITPTGLTASSGSAPVAGNIPPSTNTCSGFYASYMNAEPSHKNYGDPNCELIKKDPNGTLYIDKDAELKQLQAIKPSEAQGWFYCVLPNESSYNANAYLKASTSGKGAYGLVQMNPTGQGNGPLDDGEVYWPTQLSNGIQYNDTKIGHTFSYWPHGPAPQLDYRPCLEKYGISIP